MIASPDQHRSLAQGTVELLSRRDGSASGQLVNSASRQFAGGVGFVESTALLAGPHAAIAIITIAALTELANHLNQAFGAIQAQLSAINAKLDANFRATVVADFAQASASHATAVSAERQLRTTGSIPPAIPIGAAAFGAATGWVGSLANIGGLRRTLQPLVDDAHSAANYVNVAEGALP